MAGSAAVTAAPLSGSAREPAAGGPARSLVVLLHGWGADGDDLIGLADEWAPRLPHSRFVAPNAPEVCDDNPFGRQWFSFRDCDPAALAAGAARARVVIDAFLDAELARLGLGGERLALAGFSQGAMMALHVGLRRPCAAVVSYSGALIDGASLAAEGRASPPVLLVHGDADPVVPPAELDRAAAALTALGVPVRRHLARGLGHGIDAQGLSLGAAVLAEALTE